ncbi:MAG: hypothetical protein HY861_01900 [Chlamydiia bacterium]|nr:hypothetical protein [Chlamydiia bacterium]
MRIKSRGNCKTLRRVLWELLFILPLYSDLLDLETLSKDYVLETKQIEIPGYPYAFNPSIVLWNGYVLMSFRHIPDPKTPFTSHIGLILLDHEFHPIGEPQLLHIRPPGSFVPSRADDARLFYVGEQLYITYSDNPHPELSAGGFRMVIGELHYENGHFFIHRPALLTEYENPKEGIREKNWVPFQYQRNPFLAYSINPHLIFYPIPGTHLCETIASTTTDLAWDFGIVRGGTPALELATGEYLAFFHSMKKMASVQSQGKTMAHYFIGAYTFNGSPPFTLTRWSRDPIVGAGFYTGKAYKPYWGSIQCVFPAGFILDGNTIWISYGRQDHEIWIAKLQLDKLLSSLHARDPIVP